MEYHFLLREGLFSDYKHINENTIFFNLYQINKQCSLSKIRHIRNTYTFSLRNQLPYPNFKIS
jgi:hypothetical protein